MSGKPLSSILMTGKPKALAASIMFCSPCEMRAETRTAPEAASAKQRAFCCSTELANKVQAIARKEGFTIRALMEYMMRQGIDSYESKHGKIKKIKAKGVSDVM